MPAPAFVTTIATAATMATAIMAAAIVATTTAATPPPPPCAQVEPGPASTNAVTALAASRLVLIFILIFPMLAVELAFRLGSLFKR